MAGMDVPAKARGMNAGLPAMQRRAKLPQRTMDIGAAVAFKLLGVFDSAGILSTQADMTPPQGVTQMLVRCVGPMGGGSGTSRSQANSSGGNTYWFYYPGGSGGAFAKRMVPCSSGDVLASVTSYSSSTRGTGVAKNGAVVAYADGGQVSASDSSTSGGSSTRSLGDLTRSGGGGSCSTCGGGGDGEQGWLGTGGGSVYNPVGAAAQQKDDSYDYYGGSGGSAGDYGDPDGIGIGWSTDTGQRLSSSSSGSNRIIIHFYGYR